MSTENMVYEPTLWHTNSNFYGVRTPTSMPNEPFLLGAGVVFNLLNFRQAFNQEMAPSVLGEALNPYILANMLLGPCSDNDVLSSAASVVQPLSFNLQSPEIAFCTLRFRRQPHSTASHSGPRSNAASVETPLFSPPT